MAPVTNIFTNGRMDSDTDYSLLDNKGYVYALNMRPAGYGKDGTMHFIKGSANISDFSENGTMTVLGMYGGSENKLYSFLGRRDGLSKIVETDMVSGENKLIVSDSEILRFDLIRWENGAEINPKRYLLSIDQIDDLLFFSNEVWEYPRVLNLKRDYTAGFSAEDIILSKKPPRDAPKILSLENNKHENDDNDVFVSFAYRYKYLDGDYSTLSFYSDTAFDPAGNIAVINSKRDNVSMVNKWDTVKLAVESGGHNVTDIEVYAVEHGSNTAYLIYSANKKDSHISDDTLVANIEYAFSRNYEVLNEEDTLMLFSNVPKFPKTQTAVGNRIVFANYKEGYDLDGVVDFEVSKVQTEYKETLSRKTAVSLFKYKVALVYLNDYNEGTTGLLPTDQSKSEVEIGFGDRFKNNGLRVTLKSKPPQFATKLKFAVKAEELNYEILYINYAKRIDGYLYVLLSQENINKIKKGDIVFQVQQGITVKNELYVEDVKTMNKEDGVTVTGLYAKISEGNTLIDIQNNGNTISKNYIKDADGNSVAGWGLPTQEEYPQDYYFDGTYLNIYSGSKDLHGATAPTWIANHVKLKNSDFGAIQEGDVINIDIVFTYYLQSEKNARQVSFKIEMLALRDYDSIKKALKDLFFNPYLTLYNLDDNSDELYFYTNSQFPSYLREKYPDIFTFQLRVINAIRLATNLSVKIKKGIKPIKLRTNNKSAIQSFYYETPNVYSILNGKVIGDSSDAFGNPVFDIGFYNGYCWGDGFESYKIKDNFNGKPLRYKFRPNMVDKKGYRQVHRRNDITYSGLYNHELGINRLSEFNPALGNWKNLPIHYGEIQRIISTDGDISVFCTDKVINQYYGKSIIADLQGNENVAMTKEVLGDYQVLPYTFGTQHPESVTKSVDGIYFVDQKRTRYLFKADRQIMEMNPEGSGHQYEGVKELKANSNFLGSYNEAHGEVNFGLGNSSIIVFNPQAKGFSHYYDFSFDYIAAMNGRHFTGYGGKIYKDEATEEYNTFAGGQYREAEIRYVVNPEMTTDKVFQAMMLSSNSPWNAEIKTNLTATKIPMAAFQKRESFFYTNIFRDIETTQNSKGVGVIKELHGNQLVFSRNITNEICVGDTIVDELTNMSSVINNIYENTITIDKPFGAVGNYCYVKKSEDGGYRPDGAPMRGKWMEVSLKLKSKDGIFLNSTDTELVKSW